MNELEWPKDKRCSLHGELAKYNCGECNAVKNFNAGLFMGLVTHNKFKLSLFQNEPKKCIQFKEGCWELEQLRKNIAPFNNALKRIVELEEEVKRLRAYADYILMEGSWQGCDIDGGDAQDKAVELGLVELRPVDENENEYGEKELYFTKWTPKSLEGKR